MTTLGDHMERLMTGRPAGVAAPAWPELLRVVEATAGSGRKAAKMLGVSVSTWQRWKAGTTPKAHNRERFGVVERAIRTRPVLTNADLKVTVQRLERRRDRRPLDVTAQRLKIRDPRAAGRIRAAYLSGGKEAAATAFLAEIGDRWYRTNLTAAHEREQRAQPPTGPLPIERPPSGDAGSGTGGGGGGGAAGGGSTGGGTGGGGDDDEDLDDEEEGLDDFYADAYDDLYAEDGYGLAIV